MKNTIAMCVFFKDNKLLLEKRKKDEDNFAGKWAFPGGHVEQREKVESALLREMKEELGIDLIKYEFIGMIEDTDPTSKQLYKHNIFFCKKWKGKIQGTAEEERLKWININKIKRMRNVSKPTLDVIELIKGVL